MAPLLMERCYWSIPNGILTAHDVGGLPVLGCLDGQRPPCKREWEDWLFSGSCGSVASALDFQSLILSSIPGQKLVFLTLSSSRPV